MTRLFGTDGIRGVAGEYPITAEIAVKVGQSIAGHFRRGRSRPTVIVGRDTRLSGGMLESALAAGLSSCGADVYLAGVLPTPGIAFLARDLKTSAGVVISASHNPYQDNGIKIFGGDGFKLSGDDEAKLEAVILGNDDPVALPAGAIGGITVLPDAAPRYADFLASAVPRGVSFGGLTLVIDCANGATSAVAPGLFCRLGAKVFAVNASPDGININKDCGSEHPAALAREVRRRKADLGLAFDGDGDRLVAVDEKGSVLTGDQIIAVFARAFKAEGKLKSNLVVTTMMSNLGLSVALRELGIRRAETKIGDRCVLAEMLRRRAILGGEDSGHFIFLDRHTTGDGLFSAVRLLSIVKKSRRPLSELARGMRVFPQVLINVRVREKTEISSLPAVACAIRRAEEKLRESGRVLVRYSGTQSLCRVMVEGPTPALTRRVAEELARAVEEALG